MNLNWIWESILILFIGIAVLRISGRKSVAQMTISQSVLMVSIGTLLISPVSSKNVWVTFLTAFLIIGILMLIEWAQVKWDFAERLLTGTSKIVIDNGDIQEGNLKKMRMTVDNLEMRLRQSGIDKISDVKWATVEPSGLLGYILKDQKKNATKEDIENLTQAIQELSNTLNTLIPQQAQLSRTSETNLFSEIAAKRNIPEPPPRLQ